MSDKSKIEWTDATWNPIRGCSRVSEGCRNCYAERQAVRFTGNKRTTVAGTRSGPQPYSGLVVMQSDGPHWTGEVRFIEEHAGDPLHWRVPRRIFVNSMSDLFHEKVVQSWIDRIFAVMSLCPQHTFQILTKRADRMFSVVGKCNGRDLRRGVQDVLSRGGGAVAYGDIIHELFDRWPLPNVHLGVSVEDQKTADERIPSLLQTPAAVRWVSYEPALGPIDSRRIHYDNTVEIDSLTGDHGVYRPLAGKSERKVDWIVAGGESGPGARPAHPDWFRSVRDQCVAAGVPFFFKQWGEWGPIPSKPFKAAHYHWVRKDGLRHGMCEESSGDICMALLHKKTAGRLLDGREWNEFPVLAARAQEENAK